MCGIAGWAGSPEADRRTLRRMCDALVHRGPDDERMYLEPGKVALGFRRLSIIDLETGAQPLASERGDVQVTCNGEIYNFGSLRRGLEERGHAFASRSDIEVIVHLYEERGLDCLTALQGMFALALWDAARGRLVLARDRLGVKPLYFAQVPGGLVYGSEPSAILASGLVAAKPDPTAIVQYLTLQYVPAPLTGFSSIRKLAPGERLVYEAGTVRIERWWSLPTGVAPDAHDEDALDHVDALLADATRSRLTSDVPLGAFLSGGIDSTLVVGYMAEELSQVRTFSIDFPEAAYSEGEHARRVAELYGTDHTEYVVEPEMVPTVARAARTVGEPFADSSLVPTYLLCERARAGVTVALSGDGGDEAFGGYWRYRRAHVADALRPARALARAALLLPIPAARQGTMRDRLEALAQSPHERYATMMSHFVPPHLARLVRPDVLEAAGGARRAWDEVLVLPAGGGVDRYLRLDAATYLPGALLTKVDRASMAHSLEVRSPLLDYRVFELAARLPGRLKVRRGTTKWILRQLALRRGVPHAIAERPKKGFSMPIGTWFRGSLRPWLLGVLRDPRTRERGYFIESEVERLLDDHLQGARDHSPRLWNLLMLELWHREWVDG